METTAFDTGKPSPPGSPPPEFHRKKVEAEGMELSLPSAALLTSGFFGGSV